MSNNQAVVQESSLHITDYLKVLKTRWKEAILVFLLVFSSCAVITKSLTPTYQSSMRFEIKMPVSLIDPLGGAENPIDSLLAGPYMMTQFEIMVSEPNLKDIVKNLDLQTEWATSEMGAVNQLKGMIRIVPVRGKDMVDVMVSSTDPKNASRVCLAVSESYSGLREKEVNDHINQAIEVRYEILRSRRDEMENKADIVREYIRTGDYLSPSIWRGGDDLKDEDMIESVYNSRNADKNAIQNEISTMMVHMSELQKLQDEELLSYVTRTGLLTAESYCSNRVRSLNDQYKKEEATRVEMLMSGYAEMHPHVKLLDNQHSETSKELYRELVGMRDAMQSQIAVKKAELGVVLVRLSEAKEILKLKMVEDRSAQMAIEDYNTEKLRYDKLNNDYIVDKTRLLMPRQTIKILRMPVVAGAPSSPNISLNLTIGLIIGLLAGVLVAFACNYFDTSIKTLEEAEIRLGLPVLGVIPQDAPLLILNGADNIDAEAYRILRTNIELRKPQFKSSVYVVISANAGEGKTTSVSNLAYVFAQSGLSTLMIDSDLRRSRLAQYTEVKSDVGLSNFLSSDMELRDVIFKTSATNLFILPSGPSPLDPSGLIGSHRMDQMLQEVRHRFDVVIIDAPPILGVSDASLLVSKADAALWVMQPRKLPLKALTRTKTLVAAAGGKIMGLVMNNVDISGDTQYQYYTSYYSYYSSDTKRSEPKDITTAKKNKRSKTSQGADLKDDKEDIRLADVKQASKNEDLY